MRCKELKGWANSIAHKLACSAEHFAWLAFSRECAASTGKKGCWSWHNGRTTMSDIKLFKIRDSEIRELEGRSASV
jgi:hypothetical protein